MDHERISHAELELARKIYADDDIQIDHDAHVTRAEDGVWVQAWVFVSSESLITSAFGALPT